MPDPAAEAPWTVKRLLEWTREHFRKKGVEEPRLSADVLLAHVLGVDRLKLFLRFDDVPDESARTAYRGLVGRRARHEPLGYLTGKASFYGFEFVVGPAVLIPRPETEMLVDEVSAELGPRRDKMEMPGTAPGPGASGSGFTAIPPAELFDAGSGAGSGVWPVPTGGDGRHGSGTGVAVAAGSDRGVGGPSAEGESAPEVAAPGGASPGAASPAGTSAGGPSARGTSSGGSTPDRPGPADDDDDDDFDPANFDEEAFLRRISAPTSPPPPKPAAPGPKPPSPPGRSPVAGKSPPPPSTKPALRPGAPSAAGVSSPGSSTAGGTPARSRGPAGGSGRRVIDLCTGSGCVACAVARVLPGADVVATDISPDALAVARENARLLEVAGRVTFLQGDLFAALPEGSPPADVITANPPYIRTAELPKLDATVRDFEPPLALDGGGDGLALVRRILAGAARHLRPGGLLLMEIGFDQGPAVKSLAEAVAGLADVAVLPDMQGHPRVLRARRKPAPPSGG